MATADGRQTMIDHLDAQARHSFALWVKNHCDGSRGDGRQVTDVEQLAHIAQVQRDIPGATRRGELEYAWWILGFAISQARWFRAWDRIAQPV